MVKSLILSLNFLLAAYGSFCQQASHAGEKCDCSDKKVRDSLSNKYLDKGAYQYSYNSVDWQLYCDSLIAICPNIAEAYQRKAIPYIKFGDYAKAFPLEDKAVELEPKNYTAYRGFLKCIFTKDYEGAIIDFQKAQQLTPNSYEMDHTYPFYEGLCNLELGNYSLAAENFKKDIFIQTRGDIKKQSSIHFNTFFYLGVLYYEMKENDKAKDNLQKCIAVYQSHPDANYYLALVYKRDNNMELYNKYLQLAKAAKEKGFDINEDNTYYAYYPHQITLYEINNEMVKENK
jgi:tetratricopeptide (TPR) repeat protein